MLNILIPMAGKGSRFADAGYDKPKPLIDVNGKPMVQVVVENMMTDAYFIFVLRRDHCHQYGMAKFLRTLTPYCSIVTIDAVTEGACCTTLLAEDYFNNDNPLLIVNSDQYVDWNKDDFYHFLNRVKSDGTILTFYSQNPHCSYVRKVGRSVVEVKEKEVISNTATVGIYYWKRGSDYVRYARQMIEKNIRTNGEFFVAPVYNEAILDGKKITTYNVGDVWNLGTPEDLNLYLTEYGRI
jgi:dTDP-glucose pyrophosphorylase